MTTRLEPVLLPCPLCGSSSLNADFHRLHGSVECNDCGCTVPLPEKSPEIQALRWNDRSRAAPAPEGMRRYRSRIIDIIELKCSWDDRGECITNADRAADAILAIIAKGAGLVGFDPVSTTRTHSPAKIMGDVTRADFGPDGPEGDVYFEAYVEAISETPK